MIDQRRVVSSSAHLNGDAHRRVRRQHRLCAKPIAAILFKVDEQTPEVDRLTYIKELRNIAGLRQKALAVELNLGNMAVGWKAQAHKPHEFCREAHIGDALALIKIAFTQFSSTIFFNSLAFDDDLK